MALGILFLLKLPIALFISIFNTTHLVKCRFIETGKKSGTNYLVV